MSNQSSVWNTQSNGAYLRSQTSFMRIHLFHIDLLIANVQFKA